MMSMEGLRGKQCKIGVGCVKEWRGSSEREEKTVHALLKRKMMERDRFLWRRDREYVFIHSKLNSHKIELIKSR